MKEKENQTLQKEYPRSSDLANRRSKDFQAKKISKKIAQKSLIETFISPIEDVLPEISEDSIDFSSVSAITNANYHGETADSLIMVSYPSPLTSSEAFTPSELTPCSNRTTANRVDEIDSLKTGPAEVEIMMNLLKQSRLQALNSVDLENKSKKVLDALIEFTINEFYSLPEETYKLPQLFNRNAHVGFLCFLLWLVAVLLSSFYLFYLSRIACSFTRLPPT